MRLLQLGWSLVQLFFNPPSLFSFLFDISNFPNSSSSSSLILSLFSISLRLPVHNFHFIFLPHLLISPPTFFLFSEVFHLLRLIAGNYRHFQVSRASGVMRHRRQHVAVLLAAVATRRRWRRRNSHYFHICIHMITREGRPARSGFGYRLALTDPARRWANCRVLLFDALLLFTFFFALSVLLLLH